MRIAIATAVYYPQINGVAIFSHNLATGLARRGHHVMVICPSQTGRNYTETQDGVEVCYLRSIDTKVYPDQIHSVPPRRKVGKLKVPRLAYRHGFHVSVFPQLEVKRILGRFRPDVVHVQVSDPIGLSVVSYARRNHIPIVTTEHNQPEVLTEPLKIPGAIKKPTNAILSAYFRNRQSKSDFVTMPTELAIQELFANKKNLGIPIAAVSNGVDLSSFCPGPASSLIYEKYHIPKHRPIILYVGRVDPEKQVGRVISAFKKARPELPKTSPILLIVGDGVDKARLEKESKDQQLQDSIIFLGKVLPPDLYELYKAGTIFVTASEIETQGIVLIEAAACGLPLVAVNKGAVGEVCRDGQNGILCPAGDTNAIAAAIIKIMNNKQIHASMSKQSIEIASKHDFERTLDRFIDIYQQVINHHQAQKT